MLVGMGGRAVGDSTKAVKVDLTEKVTFKL